MKTLKFFILVLCLNVCGQAMAQKSLVSLVKKVETLIDSMSVKGIDRHYIDMPEKPWQLIVRGNVSQTIVNMTTEGHMAGEKYSANPYLETTPAEYTGLWVGYRGYGLGYMVNVGGDKSSYFTIVRQKFYDQLPSEFNRQTYLTVATSLGIPIKTAEKQIARLCEKGLLKHLAQGKYGKP